MRGGGLGGRSVFWRSGGWGCNRRHRRERNRITALLPLWLLWLLRTTASAAVSPRVERLRLGARLLLRAVPGAASSRAARGSAFRKATCDPLPGS